MRSPFSAEPGRLRMAWQQLTGELALPQATSDSTWDALVQHYSEPHRAYHNLSHISALLHHAEVCHAHIRHPGVIAFAIWFHDVIYDTRSQDNEERSAKWAEQAMLAMGADAGLIDAVQACILATRRHEIITTEVPDLPLFLDMDLAILGADGLVYRDYSEAIRREYHWVPEVDYRRGRMAVLKQFIERPRLFFTPLMASRLESRARHNISAEITQLSAQGLNSETDYGQK